MTNDDARFVWEMNSVDVIMSRWNRTGGRTLRFGAPSSRTSNKADCEPVFVRVSFESRVAEGVCRAAPRSS
jgi:hypothetical protein